jgi:hypothetical protein
MQNPLDEETKAQMQEKITETMTTFGSAYTGAFKSALISHCQKEADEDTSYQLVDAPLASEPLKSAWMMKLGSVRKNWKKRWFVVFNEADNFNVGYYADDKLKKKKGEISLCGYALRDFTDEEKKKTGDEHGIALFKDGSREWMIRCVPDTPENKAAWMATLQIACNKAKPPIGATDKVSGAAFMGAYNATRSAHEIEVAEKPSGTEEESLSTLVTAAIQSMIDTVLEAIPDGPAKGMATKAANSAIGTMIKTAVMAGWKAMKSAMDSTRSILETGIKAALKPLNDGKKMLNDKAAEMCSSVMKPVADKAVESKLKPVLGAISGPVGAGYVEAVTLFSKLAKEVRDKTKGDAATLDANVAEAYKQADTTEVEALGSLGGALGEIAEALGDFPADDIVGQIQDQVRILVKKGIATMALGITKDSQSPDDAYTATLAKVIHDAKCFVSDTMSAVLAGLIKPQFDSEVKPLVLEPIEPVGELIPDAIKDFVSIPGIVEDLLDNVIDTAVGDIVAPVASPEAAKLDDLAGSLA